MKAVRVHAFGDVDAMVCEDVPLPTAGSGELLVRVEAAGVGPWDAWVRAGKSALPQPLPLTLGSDLAGIVVAVGADVTAFRPGDEVFGVTNARFTGAYAEYAIAEAAMVAAKPASLDWLAAASVPVVACTAWQMIFEYGQVEAGAKVLVQGAAGNVGAYAVQFAHDAGAQVIACAYGSDLDYVRSLGADTAIDVRATRFEDVAQEVDAVIDTVGGETATRSLEVLRRGGVLVSSVAEPDGARAAQRGVRAVFFLVAVTGVRLNEIANRLAAGRLRTNVGEVLPLAAARTAHQMLAGKRHRRGKIVLRVGGGAAPLHPASWIGIRIAAARFF